MSNGDEVRDTDPTGRYVRFDDELGRGAYKVVYRAIDRDRGVEVAWNQIKVDQRADFEKLWKEITILQSLSHPNILVCHAAWVDEKQLHVAFITECMTSGTIRQFMKKAKSVKLKVIKNWCSQILSGLDYLHTREPPIIHRDIKCDNILINGTSGVVKIGDLGLATNILNYTGTKLSIIGTPEFMAPEYYEEVYDEKVDIWAFGMCLLEMATLEYPFSECTNPAQIFKKVSSGQMPRSLLKLKDVDIIQFLLECLAPASKRKSAQALLLHPFLQSIDDDRNLQLRTEEEVEELIRNGVTVTALASGTAVLSSPPNINHRQMSNGGITNCNVHSPATPHMSIPNGNSALHHPNNNHISANHALGSTSTGTSLTSNSSLGAHHPLGAPTPSIGIPRPQGDSMGNYYSHYPGASGLLAASPPPSMPSAPISIPGRKDDLTNHMEYTTSLTKPVAVSVVSTMSSSVGDSSDQNSHSGDSPPMSLTAPLPPMSTDQLLAVRSLPGNMTPPRSQSTQLSASQALTSSSPTHSPSSLQGHPSQQQQQLVGMPIHAQQPPVFVPSPGDASLPTLSSSPTSSASLSERHPPVMYHSQIPPVHLGPGSQNDMIITVLNTPQSRVDPMIVSLQLAFGVTGIVEFDFRIDSDTAHSVASEMSQEFHLPPALLNVIAKYINDKVSEYIHIMRPELQISPTPSADMPLAYQRMTNDLDKGLLSPPSSLSGSNTQIGSSPRRFVSNMSLDRMLSMQLAGSREVAIDNTGTTPTDLPPLLVPSLGASTFDTSHTPRISETLDDLVLPSPRRNGVPPLKRAYSSAVTTDQAIQLQQQLQHQLNLQDGQHQLHHSTQDPNRPDSARGRGAFLTGGAIHLPHHHSSGPASISPRANVFLSPSGTSGGSSSGGGASYDTSHSWGMSHPNANNISVNNNSGNSSGVASLNSSAGSNNGRSRSASAVPPRTTPPSSMDHYQQPIQRSSQQLAPHLNTASTNRSMDDSTLARPASHHDTRAQPHLGNILHEISADMQKNSGYFESALRDFESHRPHLDDITAVEAHSAPALLSPRSGHDSDDEDEEDEEHSEEGQSPHIGHRSSPVSIGGTGGFNSDHVGGSLSIPTPFGEVVIAAPHSPTIGRPSPSGSARASLTTSGSMFAHHPDNALSSD